ncbi:DNA repair protein [Sphingomonas spermidinifaciens]|uniref:DNA repair protein n=1 Tax=Sphingomonas spermidinifaciens TaxID=1141889 RepID=A0A2A4B1N3_9SPHN|nr:JAB domain-containing protein [Sphingomonas spermidinifaciens]PCD01852.1 DNA repair protein [Sphingomonas spermidinifaciens]
MGAAIQCLVDISAARAIFAPLGVAPIEIAAFALLDRSHRIIAVRQSAAGDVGAVAIPLRAVAQEAMTLNAAGVVMAHNHPSADPRPSAADIAVTRHAERVFGMLDLKLVDHLIVTRGGLTSFRSLGLL